MTIIDLRTPAEFSGGCVAGSINISLQEIASRVEDIQQMEQPLILCCASGGRSGSAAAFLKSKGISCENGGSWMDVNNKISNQK
jgi:rhodanese-related sulfurtransferase